MKKIILYFLPLIIFFILIDYFFFYKKISNYKNDIGISKNLIVLTGGNHRVKKTLSIFFKIKNPDKKLFISGVGPGFNKNILKHLTKQYKNNLKIVECCITFEDVSKNTYSNAKESLKWVQSQNISTFILLTSNYHMPRAILEFKNVFIDYEIKPYVLIDTNNKWYMNLINFISEYFKFKVAFVRLNFL